MHFFLGLGVLVIVVLVLFFVTSNVEDQRLEARRRRFKDRPPMPVHEIYNTYYGASAIDEEAFARTWKQVAELLKIDPERLRPTDSFFSELALVAGSMAEDETSDLDDLLLAACKEKGLRREDYDPRTLGELVEIIAGTGKVNSVCCDYLVSTEETWSRLQNLSHY